MKIIGMVLFTLGILGLAYGGISWTRKDKVVDVGPVEITADKHESFPVPPVVGAVCLVAGIAMVFVGGRKGIMP